MFRPKVIFLCTFVWFAADRLFGNDPAPTQTISSDGLVYHSPIPVNSPFPDSVYGASHGGSTLVLTYPFLSPFGNPDHSRGQFIYSCAAFRPRGSEGVFGMDVWLEQMNPDGSWSPVGQNGGLADNFNHAYQTINTPNPGPSPSYTFHWTFDVERLPPRGVYRVFVYVYIYNQGGGSQGDYAIYSATPAVSVGAANDAPRIKWSPSAGTTNPTSVHLNQTYMVSADGEDDNGDLATVSIDKNGVPFAYAPGGNGYAGNSQNSTSDPEGTVTYTAWATDAEGAQSPTITWTVTVLGKSSQAPVSSSDATITLPQTFTPSYLGGSGSGAWQFCIANFTNWTGGADNNAGTQLSPSGVWSPSWAPPAAGTYTFYVAKDGDANFAPSNIAGPYTLTVLPAALLSQTVSVAPTIQTLVAGGSVTFTATGGANDYTWGGNASGAGSAQTVGFPTPGNFAVTVFSPGGNGYSPSNTASAAITVTFAPQFVSVLPTNADIRPGESVTFIASGGGNGYVWGGSASGAGPAQTVTFPVPGTFGVTVYSPGGGAFLESNVAAATVRVSPESQTVSLSPLSPTVTVGGSIQFTATGGQNGYVWGGAASGAGPAQVVLFPNVGSYGVSVYSPAGGIFGQSNTANASISVTAADQDVTVTPAAPVISAGQSVTFTASGGMNGYVWGGSATGSGTTQTLTFANPGTFFVTVHSPAGGNFSASNTASATITVNDLPPPDTAEVIIHPQGGEVKVENSRNQHNGPVLVPGS